MGTGEDPVLEDTNNSSKFVRCLGAPRKGNQSRLNGRGRAKRKNPTGVLHVRYLGSEKGDARKSRVLQQNKFEQQDPPATKNHIT